MGRKVISQYNGHTGRVFIDGDELCVTGWNISLVADEEDTTNSCSAGFSEFDFGTITATGTVTADYDITVNPFDDPPYIRPGTFADLKLYIHSAAGIGLQDGPFWSFNAGINNVQMSVPAKGKVGYSFDYKSNGVITYPTSGESAS